MKLAYVSLTGRGMVDELLAEVARTLVDDGVRLAGTVRDTPVDPGRHRCDMDLRVLPDGPKFRISQPLGSGSRGCRLDGGAIETISAAVETRLAGADLLIVNKFGRQEALGRGLSPAISTAMEWGIPTLVGVNEMNAPDFLAFTDGIAERLPHGLSAVRVWFDAVRECRSPILV